MNNYKTYNTVKSHFGNDPFIVRLSSETYSYCIRFLIISKYNPVISSTINLMGKRFI